MTSLIGVRRPGRKEGGRPRVADFHVYGGLGGDTDPGRFVSSGLYRSRNGEGAWESIGANVMPSPQVRAILTDAAHPGRVTVGTQDGIWRSEDSGETWRRLSAPSPGLAVWSLARHPTESETRSCLRPESRAALDIWCRRVQSGACLRATPTRYGQPLSGW
jgi:hypothetical protein